MQQKYIQLISSQLKISKFPLHFFVFQSVDKRSFFVYRLLAGYFMQHKYCTSEGILSTPKPDSGITAGDIKNFIL